MKATSAMQASKLQLQHILARLRKSSFVKNVLVVMSGTAAAQALGFALSPLISRLFSPSDFGVFGSFYAVFSIITAGVTLDYSQAIMLPKEKKDAINLFMLSCVFTALITACCLVVYLLAPVFFQGLMKAPNAWMPVLLVVAVLASGLNQGCQVLCVRIKAFKHTSVSQVIRSLSSNGTQVGLGYLKGGPLALIWGVILGEVLASLNLVRVLLPELKTFRHDIRWDQMKQVAKEYRDFPMYSASKNIINSLSSGLAVLLLAYFYGIEVAGAYAFGFRILGAPMEFVRRPLRQVLFQKASETQHQGSSLTLLYAETTTALFALAIFPSLVLFIRAPELFTWVFGSQWHTAGGFARSLVLWLMFAFCNLPATLFARLIRIQRTVFIYDLGLLAARALALVLGGLYLSASHTIMLFSVVGAAMNFFLILLVGHAVMKQDGHTSLGSIQDILRKG